jgi:hypothetical protein
MPVAAEIHVLIRNDDEMQRAGPDQLLASRAPVGSVTRHLADRHTFPLSPTGDGGPGRTGSGRRRSVPSGSMASRHFSPSSNEAGQGIVPASAKVTPTTRLPLGWSRFRALRDTFVPRLGLKTRAGRVSPRALHRGPVYSSGGSSIGSTRSGWEPMPMTDRPRSGGSSSSLNLARTSQEYSKVSRSASTCDVRPSIRRNQSKGRITSDFIPDHAGD